MLEVRGAVRRYGELVALNGVDLEVASGEVVALLGENGAGKSTLVEAIGGSLCLNGGSLRLQGRDYAPSDPRKARAAGVAVVHQHDQLVEAFTVMENLSLAFAGWSPSQAAAAWSALGGRLGVVLPAGDVCVRDLGVGERQWVEIAKALLVNPRVLLLDEPTAVLTPGEADRLFMVVRSLAAAGMAVVFITHRLDEVARIADRVVVLRRGTVVASRAANAPSSELAMLMTGELSATHPHGDHVPGEIVVRARDVALPPRLLPLDLDLRAGEIVVLAGVDGNGQVAAAERLAGLDKGPGTVEIVGFNQPARGDIRMGVGLVPADRRRQGLFPNLSVAENLAIGRLDQPPFRGGVLSPRRVLSESRKEIDRFAVVAQAGQRVAALSGGNQQKVVVARALAAGWPVVVAIHPTRGLDVAAQNVVRQGLGDAAGDGSAVLVVTSDLDEARLLGDRIVVFSRGRAIGEGGRDTPREQLARWVGGEAA